MSSSFTLSSIPNRISRSVIEINVGQGEGAGDETVTVMLHNDCIFFNIGKSSLNGLRSTFDRDVS